MPIFLDVAIRTPERMQLAVGRTQFADWKRRRGKFVFL